ncbi:DNA cytosine methyltransferase [Aliarcobacter skirrowii]|uniref:DNA cytosine methyltransferase n=1 Tax=Aliarcobacter skirrowii TaxID=28200 RepID=UPI0029B30CBA|nr:DNA cytosine methyltransferase [Aliarcobacter skirrowii]MDX4060729.1 DNA cytosine methyltransferase [Aliarcobacter skirrowii]
MNKKLKGLSLFSNVGVAEAYLDSIGIDVVLANEIDEQRAKFYKHLYPKTEMIVGDITNKKIFNEIIKKAKEIGIDFIIATPPCQGMSLAGKMDPNDERNHLITYAIEIIKILKPKFVFLENVPQQLKTTIRYKGELIKIPDYINKELSDIYSFNQDSLIKTMDYSIPQMRKRNIFLLSRKDTGIKWEFPKKHNKIITLKDALRNVPSLDPYLREGMIETLQLFPDYEKKKKEGLKVSKWHYPPTHSKRHVEWLIRTPSGQTAFDNEIYFPKKENGQRINGHYNTYRRLSWDKPSRTITQNNGVISSLACVHPGYKINDSNNENLRIYSDPRCFSIYELMIISSIPLDWNIPEWANERMIRHVIGEGIPSKLVKYIFNDLLESI